MSIFTGLLMLWAAFGDESFWGSSWQIVQLVVMGSTATYFLVEVGSKFAKWLKPAHSPVQQCDGRNGKEFSNKNDIADLLQGQRDLEDRLDRLRKEVDTDRKEELRLIYNRLEALQAGVNTTLQKFGEQIGELKGELKGHRR